MRGPSATDCRPVAVTAAGRQPGLTGRLTGSTRPDRGAWALEAQRRLQVALGLLWLADGALQLQPLMFSRSFVTQIIAPNAVGQPGLIAAPVMFIAHLIEPRVALFNALAASVQLLIGVGLIYRPTLKVALLASSGGAPGRRYGSALLCSGCCQPTAPPARCTMDRQRAVRGRLAVEHSVNRRHGRCGAGPGDRNPRAGLSATIGLGVLLDRWTRPLLALSVVIAMVYFVVGQGMGGVLTGLGTDPGTGPLLILLAASVYPLHRPRQPRGSGPPPAGTLRIELVVERGGHALSPAGRKFLSAGDAKHV